MKYLKDEVSVYSRNDKLLNSSVFRQVLCILWAWKNEKWARLKKKNPGSLHRVILKWKSRSHRVARRQSEKKTIKNSWKKLNNKKSFSLNTQKILKTWLISSSFLTTPAQHKKYILAGKGKQVTQIHHSSRHVPNLRREIVQVLCFFFVEQRTSSFWCWRRNSWWWSRSRKYLAPFQK